MWLVVTLSDIVCLQFMIAYSMQELLKVCKNFSLNCKTGSVEGLGMRLTAVSIHEDVYYRSNAHRTWSVRDSPDTCVIIQKSEEATASLASLLATP